MSDWRCAYFKEWFARVHVIVPLIICNSALSLHMLSVPPLSAPLCNFPRRETPPQPVVRLEWVERAIIARA